MDLIKKIIHKYKLMKKEKEEKCSALISKIDIAIQDKCDLLINEDFIESSKVTEWYEKYSSLISEINSPKIKKLKYTKHYSSLITKKEELQKINDSLKEIISIHNQTICETKLENAYNIIGKVEEQTLDKQQMMCIIKETHNHLVVAGAGTGKTTTIIGKIKYLLKSEQCSPEDILVLSFTNASAYEMSQRINKETNVQIEASTFHKLGLNIITEVNNISPKITNLNLRKFINDKINIFIQNNEYLKLLNNYILKSKVAAKSESEFQTMEEYEEYLKLNPPNTINGEKVKSYGEVDIANFLAQNKVAYIYEKPYEKDTRTNEYNQYYPDFYLPEYNIYIEYFGINQNGEVPSYFKKTDNKTATETYQEGIA